MPIHTDATGCPAAGYPVMLDLRGRRCLVVGGGTVAHRKIAGLLDAGATVDVVAPCVEESVPQLEGSLVVTHRRYRPSDLDDVHLVITCTDDPEVNRWVAEDAAQRRIWVNSADDPSNCTFTLPAVARRGDLTLTISTNGRSPALARWLRRRFEREFDEAWVGLLDVLAEVRAEARATFGTSEIDGWDRALDEALLEFERSGRTADLVSIMRSHLGLEVAA